jgi:DNA invertase Pin-like site-specific DNA recombinase
MASSAAIYARISSDREGLQLGVQRQVEDCRALADHRGWTVAQIYTDDDISAYKRKPRPAYQQLLTDLRRGERDAVIVYNLDRLHRQPKELEEFFEICDTAKVRELASVAGDVDLSSDDGRFLARILGAVARKESDDKSRRIRRKHQELAQNGKVAGGGTRPFGYQSDRRTVDPTEATIIRELADRVLSGDSLRSLCANLTLRGVGTVTGAPWKIQTLRRMLMSYRLSGQREHLGELIGPAEWEPIIEPEHTERLRATLADPDRPANRTPRRYLLTRLVHCGLCGYEMVSRPRGDGERRYVCATGPGLPGCGGMAILASHLEPFVVEAVLHRLDTPGLAAALSGDSAPASASAEARRELDDAAAHLDELAGAYGEKKITLHEYLTARRPIEKRMESARGALNIDSRAAALSGYLSNPAALRREWSELSLSRQRNIIAALLDHALVASAVRGRNRFDPARVTPVWHG